MSFKPPLTVGDSIKNKQLMDIFKCSPQGGMRRSHKTNTLILISDHTKSIYEDRWIDKNFHYTGMGLRGDQSIDASQNKTLAESHTNNVDLFLFEVFQEGNYLFQGQIELAGPPYQEQQPDIEGNLRKVWIFPLKQMDESLFKPLPETIIF